MLACLAAAPLTGTQHAAGDQIARPVPTPENDPLNSTAATEFVQLLTEQAENVLDDAFDLEEVNAVKGKIGAAFAKRGAMTGKTPKQIIVMYLADASANIEDAEVVESMRSAFGGLIDAATAENEPEPQPAPAPSAEPEATPAPGPAATPAEDTKPETQPNTSASLRQYIKSLSYDPKLLLAVQPTGGELLQEKVKSTDKTREAKPGKIVRCTRTTRSLSGNFDDVARLQPTQGVIYPGALLYADQNLVDGQPRPMTGLPRAPIDLRLDLPGLEEDGSFTIANATDGKVQTAVAKALRKWNDGPSYKEGYVNASRQSYKSTVAYSSEQLAMSLGVNVKWAQGDAAAQFKFDMSNEKTVAVMMYKQVFYTVTYDAPNLPEQFFDKSVTVDEAKEAFHASKDVPSDEKQVPAYVSSVNYGRIIMFRLEADKSVLGIDAQAALNYGTGAVSVGVDAKAKYDKIISNSSITVVTMGGSAEVASQAVSARSAADLMPIIKGKNAVYSKSNPGVPIAYTVKFLKDNTIAKMGSTTDFTTTDCQELRNIWIKLVHNGWYTAHFDVTWDEEGKPNQTFHADKNKDYQQTLTFPGDTTNIRVNISNDTGLVWEPRREIINRPLVPTELNKCLIIEGTTLGSGKKFEVCETPPDEDLRDKKPQ
jgi:thiol-activated cytolysin